MRIHTCVVPRRVRLQIQPARPIRRRVRVLVGDHRCAAPDQQSPTSPGGLVDAVDLERDFSWVDRSIAAAQVIEIDAPGAASAIPPPGVAKEAKEH